MVLSNTPDQVASDHIPRILPGRNFSRPSVKHTTRLPDDISTQQLLSVEIEIYEKYGGTTGRDIHGHTGD
jgi:hypothetical protein